MNHADYHAHPAVSKSQLDAINRSPLHYWSQYVNPDRLRPEPTPAMLFGTAVHTAVLEPELFDAQYALAPDIGKTTKAGKEAWAAAAATGKQLLKPDELADIRGIRQALLEHPAAALALKAEGVAEKSIFAVDPTTGIEIKCRPDYLTDSGWVIDLKTTQDASLSGFQRSVVNFRYHVQAAHYLATIEAATGIRPKGFVFLAVEKTYPYAIQVFRCSQALLEVGAVEARSNLDALHHAKSTFPTDQPWPSYNPKVTEIDLPNWAMQPKKPQLWTY